MDSMKKTGMVMVVAALCLASATVAGAAERKALPAFALTAADGNPVESSALATNATWLFVYVQAQCGLCDALLARMGSDERASASRIVIVGAGMDAAAMRALAAKYPNLQAGRWLADPERTASAPLGVQAMPTVFGLRGSSIEWRLAGTVRNNKELDSILFTWLETR
jgi:peroxiredoxin